MLTDLCASIKTGTIPKLLNIMHMRFNSLEYLLQFICLQGYGLIVISNLINLFNLLFSCFTLDLRDF